MPSVTIHHDSLQFRFPEVHPEAQMTVSFQRTLRMPDDGQEHPLPPGLGRFPLRDVDDHAARIPQQWARRGGVMLPMYQSEALWLSFGSRWSSGYGFAVKVSTGGICALTGARSRAGLKRRPQNYLVLPDQPWLDGYNVGGDAVRQFVAAPLDHEALVERQLTGEAVEGGMDLEVFPMTAEAWKRHRRSERREAGMMLLCEELSMGFAAGGKLRQQIYEDPHRRDDWSRVSATCRVNVCNALAWRAITDEWPPSKPPGPIEYSALGLPFFHYYDDTETIRGSKALAALASYGKGVESVGYTPASIVELRRAGGVTRGGVRWSAPGRRRPG